MNQALRLAHNWLANRKAEVSQPDIAECEHDAGLSSGWLGAELLEQGVPVLGLFFRRRVAKTLNVVFVAFFNKLRNKTVENCFPFGVGCLQLLDFLFRDNLTELLKPPMKSWWRFRAKQDTTQSRVRQFSRFLKRRFVGADRQSAVFARELFEDFGACRNRLEQPRGQLARIAMEWVGLPGLRR